MKGKLARRSLFRAIPFLAIALLLAGTAADARAVPLVGLTTSNALDALHLAAADNFSAEFVSAERPTKPIYRAYSNITSIY